MMPTLPLPKPYMCSDAGSFAEHTLLVRLPEIARRMITENDFSTKILANLNGLLTEMPNQPVRMIEDPGAPDVSLWEKNFSSWLGKPWGQLSFLAAEKYFYRRILEATGYFQPGPTYLLDPYRQQKEMGLKSSETAVKGLVQQLEKWSQPGQNAAAMIADALESNLWGNRADLSIWPAGGEKTLANEHLHQAEEFLLANDVKKAAEFIVDLAGKGQAVHFLNDNAGFELVSDLALADLLLRTGITEQCTLQLKAHPTFVSDALTEDVNATVNYLATRDESSVGNFGRRLTSYIRNGMIQLSSDFFWNAPLPFWDMPEGSKDILGVAGLVISKGDANYRRLTGDLQWPADTAFSRVVSYFMAPILALRVAKSEVMVGLEPGQGQEMDAREADWRTNGRWGLIQFRK